MYPSQQHAIKTCHKLTELLPPNRIKSVHLTLTLINTPSLEYEDDTSSQRTVSEILRHVDSGFAENVEDVSPALLLRTPNNERHAPSSPIKPFPVIIREQPIGAAVDPRACQPRMLTKDAVEIIDIGEATAINCRAREVMICMLGQGVRGAIVHGKGAGIETIGTRSHEGGSSTEVLAAVKLEMEEMEYIESGDGVDVGRDARPDVRRGDVQHLTH
ncbi:hypothetical protein A0H81_10252 [Grifola frondosa]|uniref:Uncharacterized protein n=1 Tax=Grifola frondosa TaxID=5627 RepID=A0A1C7LYU0_GRIFR|nr:hypothetical protein A0H81_10252 [Grifola frondosa]